MTRETLAVAPYADDLASLAAAGPGGITLVPECATPLYLYATEWTGAVKRRIYRRKLDGTDTWTLMNSSATVDVVTKIYALSDGGILVNCATLVYHSADGGENLRLVVTVAAGNNIAGWNDYRYLDNGVTVLFGVYNAGHQLWRATLADLADDGEFALVDTAVFDGITHFHGLHWHAGTERWLATCGDGAACLNAYSADDGLTWTAFEAIGKTAGLHPMQSVDVGHATELVMGQDGYGGIVRYDVATGRVRKVGYADPRAAHLYLFNLWYEDGLVYALGTYTAAPTEGKNPSIYVSPDLGETWCAWLRMPTTIRTAGIAGVVDGKLQISAHDGTNDIPYEVSAPTVALRAALLALPAGINQIGTGATPADDAATTFGTSQGGWTGNGATVAQYTSDGWDGTTCLKVTATGTNPKARSPVVTVTEGQRIFGRARVKSLGTLGRKGQLQAQFTWLPDYAQTAAPYVQTEAVEDSWAEVSIGPLLVPAGKTGARLDVLPTNTTFWVSGDEYLVDGAELYVVAANTCPSRWVLPSAPRSATAYSFAKTLEAAWTCLITWIPDVDSGLLWAGTAGYMAAGTKLCIASWKATDNDWARLYWDPGDGGKFTLEVTDDDGVTSETSAIAAATWWQKYACLRFAIRHDGDDLSLSVANGGAVEHCAATSGGTYDALAGAAITFKAGDTDGSAILPGLFRSVRYYTTALSDGDVETAMGASELAYPDYESSVSSALELDLDGLAVGFGHGARIQVASAGVMDGTNATAVEHAGGSEIDCLGTGRVTALDASAALARLVVRRAVDGAGMPLRGWEQDSCTNVRFLGQKIIKE